MTRHRRTTRRKIDWTKVRAKVQPIVTTVVWAARLAWLIAALTGHRDE